MMLPETEIPSQGIGCQRSPLDSNRVQVNGYKWPGQELHPQRSKLGVFNSSFLDKRYQIRGSLYGADKVYSLVMNWTFQMFESGSRFARARETWFRSVPDADGSA